MIRRLLAGLVAVGSAGLLGAALSDVVLGGSEGWVYFGGRSLLAVALLDLLVVVALVAWSRIDPAGRIPLLSVAGLAGLNGVILWGLVVDYLGAWVWLGALERAVLLAGSVLTFAGLWVGGGVPSATFALAVMAGFTVGAGWGWGVLVVGGGAEAFVWFRGRRAPGRPALRIRAWAVSVAVVVLVVQLVPYGRDHVNPAVVAEPTWPSVEVRALALRACFDCHSNETVWPLYTWVAPVSWMAADDVEEGRRKLNFSEFDGSGDGFDEAAATVADGTMPPMAYLAAHREARLTREERETLAAALQAVFDG